MLQSTAKYISWIALLILVGSPLLFLFDVLTLEQVKDWMAVATILWFLGRCSFLLGPKKPGKPGHP